MAFSEPFWTWLDDGSFIPKKDIANDFDQPGILHRDVLRAAMNDAVDITPGLHPPISPADKRAADPKHQFLREGASLVRLRLWAAADAAARTVTFDLYAFPRPGTMKFNGHLDRTNYNGTGIKLATQVVKCGATAPLTIVDIHPVTGEATTGLTWYEATFLSTDTYRIDIDVVKPVGNADDDNPMIYLVDMLQFNGLYLEPTTTSHANATRVAVECTRVA